MEGVACPGSRLAAVPLAEEGAPCSGGCVALGATRMCSGGGSLRELRDQEQLRGAGRQLWGEAAARPGARIQQRRPQSTGRQDTSQDLASPGTGRGPEGPGQQGCSCPELSRSAAPPQSLQALQMDCSGVTVGAEYRYPELAAATGVVPPEASRGKLRPLSPAPGSGQSSSPKC